MMKRHSLLILACLLCISLLAGCAGDTKLEERPVSGVQEDSGQITVRYFGSDGYRLIKDYNYFAPKTDKAVILETPVADYEDESGKQQFLELLTQETADVYLFSTDYMGIFYSLLNNGMFADLNPLIEESSLNLDNYQSMVMDTGVSGSKRLFLPVSYRVNMFTTTTQRLEEFGLQPSEIRLSYDNWEQTAQLLLRAFPTEQASVLSGSYSIFREMICANYLEELEKRSNFLTGQFAREVESYREYLKSCPETKPSDDLAWMNAFSSGKEESAKAPSSSKEELTLVGQMFDGNPSTAASLVRNARRDNGKEARFFAIKDSGADTYSAYANSLFAINKKCKNPQLAFEIAQFLLSEEYQRGDYFSNFECHLGGLPVHTSAARQMFETSKKETLLKGDQMVGLLEDYQGIIKNTESCGLFADTRFVDRIFDPLFEDYCKELMGTDTFCKRLDGMAELFLLER